MTVTALDTLLGGKLIGSGDLTAVVAVHNTDPTSHALLHSRISQYSPQSDRTWRLTDTRQRTCKRRPYRAALS